MANIFLMQESYNSEDKLKNLLAKALKNGHLRLVIGAGASMGFDLPNWDKLVEKIATTNSLSPDGNDVKEQSQWLLDEGFKGDKNRFASEVKKALYMDFDGTLTKLTSSPLLRALGALSMAGLRGGVTEIVSFNFDNLLALYLQCHGFVVESTAVLPSLSTKCDAEVLHVHGCLPYDKSMESRSIVFTESDYDSEVNDRTSLWNQRVAYIFRSNICLFIGLSGNDGNLRSLIMDAKANHALKESHIYWGVRFASKHDDNRKGMFKKNGIHQVTISHDDLPNWLLDITQLAAK